MREKAFNRRSKANRGVKKEKIIKRDVCNGGEYLA